MSREMEQIMKKLNEFVKQKTDGKVPTDEELDRMVLDFMDMNNIASHKPVTEKTAENAYDYLELAEQAKSRKKCNAYLQKAKALEPDNADVDLAILENETDSALEALDKLGPLIAKEKERLKQSGEYRDSMGHFWGVLETRPYMRLLQTRLECLMECGMDGLAVKQAQEMLKLNPNDNQGIRYYLAPLYALQENELQMRKLWQKYKEEDALFLLPLSVMYFKMGQRDKAAEYLEQLEEKYKKTGLRKFFKSISEMDFLNLRNFTGEYRMYDLTELQEAYHCGQILYNFIVDYFRWAQQQLKPVPRKRKKL